MSNTITRPLFSAPGAIERFVPAHRPAAVDGDRLQRLVAGDDVGRHQLPQELPRRDVEQIALVDLVEKQFVLGGDHGEIAADVDVLAKQVHRLRIIRQQLEEQVAGRRVVQIRAAEFRADRILTRRCADDRDVPADRHRAAKARDRRSPSPGRSAV